MSVTAADVEAAHQAMAELPQSGSDGLEALTTVPEVYGYIIALARHHGLDEGDAVELAARVNPMSRADVKSLERTLRALGYIVAADRLKLLSRRKSPIK